MLPEQETNVFDCINYVLLKRRGHSGLSIRTVCTDRKGSFRSVYDRKIASHFGVLDFNHVLFKRRGHNGLSIRTVWTGRYKTQVTGHRSQVTENLMKKVRHSVKLFMFICLLYFRLSHNQAYVWHGPCFPVLFWEKTTKWWKFHIVLKLEESSCS